MKGKWYSGGGMNLIEECNVNEIIYRRVEINIVDINIYRKI